MEDRRFYYFYNENFTETAIKDELKLFAGLGLDGRLTRKVLKVFDWYSEHMAGMTEGKKVYLLTSDSTSKAAYQKLLKGEQREQVIDVNDFVMQHQADFPELENYLGFVGTEGDDVPMTDETAAGDGIYSKHLEFSDLLLGVREGRLFQGRLNVSRLNMNEATVNVQGLKSEILIQDAKDQNRALNGDVVAVEILPKAKWLRGYKNVDMADAIDD